MKKVSVLLCCVILLSIVLLGCGSSASEEASVWEATKDCVSQGLKSPSTAKFPNYDEATITKTNTDNSAIKGQWHVESYVDAENSFGATLRQNFSIDIVRHTDDTVTYQNLHFNNN